MEPLKLLVHDSLACTFGSINSQHEWASWTYFIRAMNLYQATITMKKGVCIQVALTVCMLVALSLSHVCAVPMIDEDRSGSNNAILQYMTGIIECEQLVATRAS